MDLSDNAVQAGSVRAALRLAMAYEMHAACGLSLKKRKACSAVLCVLLCLRMMRPCVTK